MKPFAPALIALCMAPVLAHAGYLSPSLGIASTLAEVGSQDNYSTFTVNSAVGTPGTTVPNYSPKAFTGPVMSSITATAFLSGLPYFSSSSGGLASANLATGQLKVGAGVILNQTGVEGESVEFGSGTASQAALSDVLTFTGSIPVPVIVHLSMTVDGLISASGLGAYPVPNDSVSDIAAFSLNTNQGLAEVIIGNLQGDSLTFTNESGLGGHLSVLSSSASAIRLQLTEDIKITDANRTVLFEATAAASPIRPDTFGGIIADFEHTAALSIDLPDGLGYTSQSGVFLTQSQDDTAADTATSIPEPTAALPLLLGLLAVIRGRKADQATPAGAAAPPASPRSWRRSAAPRR